MATANLILSILSTVLIFTVLFTFFYAKEAPFVPTKKRDVARFLKLAEIKPGQKMYDLGCGDGRLVKAAADAGAEAKGIEVSFLPFLLANIRKFFSKSKSRIKIKYQNIWHANLGDADIIYVWLMPKVNEKLQKKFERELKPGTKVITYVWPIKDWRPVKIDEIPNGLKLFLYER